MKVFTFLVPLLGGLQTARFLHHLVMWALWCFVVHHIYSAVVMSQVEANATVELTPNMAGPAFDALAAFKKDGTLPPKWIQTESKLYTQKDDPMKVYEEKKGLGY